MHTCPPRTLAYLVLVLTTLAISAPVRAQGTDGAMPAPVTTTELAGYADRLALSEQQLVAFESAHDEYKKVFRELRDGDIADFLRAQRGLMGSLPDREVVHDLFETMGALQARISRLDGRLFEAIEPMLTEEQLGLLPRVRLARERVRYESQQMMWVTGRHPANLSELVSELELAPDVAVTVDAAIEQYERQIVKEMRELSTISGRMYMDLFDGLEAMGFANIGQEELLGDPEMLQKLFGAVKTLWAEISSTVTEKGSAIGNLNQRSHKSVAALLPEDAKAELRDRFYEREYPRAHSIAHQGALVRNQRALEKLPPEVQAAFAEAVAAYQRQVDRFADEAVGLILENREEFSPFGSDSEDQQARNQRLGELQTQASELRRQTEASLREIVGDDRYIRIAREPKDEADTPAPGEVDLVATGGEASAFDQYLESPLKRTDVAAIVRMLELDDGAKQIVDELYHTARAETNELDAVKRLQAANQSSGGDAGADTPAAERIATLFRLRRAAAQEIAEREAAFYDDVAIAVADTDARTLALGHLRAARQRRFRNRSFGGLDAMLGTMRNSEHTIDLFDVMNQAELDANERVTLDEILNNYDAAGASLYAARFDAQLELREGIDRWAAVAREGRDNGQWEADQNFVERKRLEPVAERLQAASGSVIALNRTSRDQMLQALSSDGARRLRRAYNRAAFPAVYRDETAVDTPLARAFGLPNLTEDQRDQLVDVAASYRPEYERLSQSMAELSSGQGFNALSFDSNDWEAHSARNAKYEKVLFDRNELNLRAISRLRSILSEEQLISVGGLPEVR